MITGQAAPHSLVLVTSTLAIAAFFQPVRRRIQSIIGRRYYHRKYDAAKTLATFSATLRQEVNLDQFRSGCARTNNAGNQTPMRSSPLLSLSMSCGEGVEGDVH